jgi:hypothetical protein
MMDTQLLHHAVREIKKDADPIQNALLTGQAKDYAEYRHLCGVLRGLATAESILKDLVQKLENDDE